MSYAIQVDHESVEQALRRIAGEEAGSALARTQAEGDLAPRVHEMRKSVKKLRGLLRLVRPVLDVAARENAVLREAGQGLSGLRDAAVQLATAEALAGPLPPRRREELLAPFRETHARHDAQADARTLPAFADAMAALAERSQGWAPRKAGWSAVEPGLRATWGAARAAMRRARRRPDADALHEWRKRVKDHWYQARLLGPVWPAMMAPHIAAADELGELLGQVNDLAVFRERLEAAPLATGLRAEAEALADARRDELMAQVLPLGRRLLTGGGRDLSERWGTWWGHRGPIAAPGGDAGQDAGRAEAPPGLLN